MKIVNKIQKIKEYTHVEFIRNDICFFDINDSLNVVDINTFENKCIISMEKYFYFNADNIYIYIYGKKRYL